MVWLVVLAPVICTAFYCAGLFVFESYAKLDFSDLTVMGGRGNHSYSVYYLFCFYLILLQCLANLFDEMS